MKTYENFDAWLKEHDEKTRKDAIDEFTDYILNSYEFDILNAEALEFMIRDAKCNLLKEETHDKD